MRTHLALSLLCKGLFKGNSGQFVVRNVHNIISIIPRVLSKCYVTKTISLSDLSINILNSAKSKCQENFLSGSLLRIRLPLITDQRPITYLWNRRIVETIVEFFQGLLLTGKQEIVLLPKSAFQQVSLLALWRHSAIKISNEFGSLYKEFIHPKQVSLFFQISF